MFKTAIFLSIIFAVIFQTNSLQCYVCYDCANIRNDYLTSCDAFLSTTTSTSTTVTTPSIITNSTESIPASNTTTPPTTTNTTVAPAPVQISDFGQSLERANTTTWECFQGTVNVNGSDVVVRGCAAGRSNQTCDMFGLKSCSFCSTDKCNAAGSIQASAAVVAVMLLSYLVKEF